MLECRIINGHPWSIGCGDPNPSKRGEDAALMSDLPVEIQHKVSDWIFGKLWKRNTPNYDYDSYELKHQIENELGIYLTNNQMKDAMLQEGFNPVEENEPYEINIKEETITEKHVNFYYSMFKGRKDVYSLRSGKPNIKIGKH